VKTAALVAPALDSPTRIRILAAAHKRFATFGYRRTGVTEIARDAGIAAATLYRYFDDKEGIFRAVVEDLYARWLSRAREVLAGPGTAIERITRLGLASVAFNTENPLIASVYRRDHEIVFAPLLDELHQTLLEQNVAMIADVLRDGIREGSVRAIDADAAAFVLYISGGSLSQQPLRSYEQIMPVFQSIIFDGLAPRRGGKEAGRRARSARALHGSPDPKGERR
jgi:AcrR family transcriptional regulator